MSAAVKISDSLISKARIHAKVYKRSTASQIEYWAKIGQIAEENPSLSYAFIHDILLSLEEQKNGETGPYQFDEGKKS